MYKAILAALAALVFSVSASATPALSNDDDYATPESESVLMQVQPRPDPADCFVSFTNRISQKTGKMPLVAALERTITYYEIDVYKRNGNIARDTFFTAMNAEFAKYNKPELINCEYHPSPSNDIHFGTFVHYMLFDKRYKTARFNLWSAEWAVSKGYDLTIKYDGALSGDNHYTPRDEALMARYNMINTTRYAWEKWTVGQHNKLIEVLDPYQDTLPFCSDVDGTRPPTIDGQESPPDVYCILFDNIQESLKDTNPHSYLPNATRYYVDERLSGLALFKGWKSIISFHCKAPQGQTCDSKSYDFDDSWPANIKSQIKTLYGTNVRCGFSTVKVPVILIDSIDSGYIQSSTHSSNTERSAPLYRVCEANSNQPFMLRIQTIRKAK